MAALTPHLETATATPEQCSGPEPLGASLTQSVPAPIPPETRLPWFEPERLSLVLIIVFLSGLQPLVAH